MYLTKEKEKKNNRMQDKSQREAKNTTESGKLQNFENWKFRFKKNKSLNEYNLMKFHYWMKS